MYSDSSTMSVLPNSIGLSDGVPMDSLNLTNTFEMSDVFHQTSNRLQQLMQHVDTTAVVESTPLMCSDQYATNVVWQVSGHQCCGVGCGIINTGGLHKETEYRRGRVAVLVVERAMK